MKFWLALLFPMLAAASPAAPPPEWLLTDLTTLPELSVFFGDANALISVRTKKGDDTQAIRPTIFVYKLDKKPAGVLKSGEDWQKFLKSYIKDQKRVVLNQDVSKPGRLLLEFTSRNKDAGADLRSLYLAWQNPDKSVTLFIYDGLGPATARNLPLVRALYNGLDQARLMEMYRADVERRKALKPGETLN